MTPRAWIRSRAKAMRAEMTPQEKAMWRLLHEAELGALNWRRQAPFGNFILDFVSHPARLVIEVDGGQHASPENMNQDVRRTAWLKSEGYHVLRFWNGDVMRAQDGVWRAIYEVAARTPAGVRMASWRADHMAQALKQNAQIASPSTGEAPRSGGGGARAAGEDRAPSGSSSPWKASPPQSSLRDDSSPIEGERE